MKFYITGANGQLGYDLNKLLTSKGYEVLATDKDSVDILNENEVVKSITEFNPDVIIHCAAWTAVDLAEDEEKLCYDVNVVGTKNIVSAAKEIDAKLIYISTDYVFDGSKDGEYEVDDAKGPLSVYGKTKLEGEELVSLLSKHFIVRISWVFGINGNNFIKTMIKLGKDRDKLTVINDQIGSPTYTADLSKLLLEMSLSEKYGTYHATNEGYCTWAEFAREIFKVTGLNVEVENILTSQYPTKATRPMNSKMSKKSLVTSGFEVLPSWESAVSRYIEELKITEEI